MIEKCRHVAKSIVKTDPSFCEIQLCCYCGRFFTDMYYHIAIECDKTSNEREDMWDNIMNVLPVEFSSYLFNLPDEDFYCILLSGNPDTLFNSGSR